MGAEPIEYVKNPQQYLGGYLTVFVVVAAIVIVVLRRPDTLLNPQFWAEDGKFWYAEAYNDGVIHSLLLPHTGYFQTIARLTAAFALIFPLAWAPFIFNNVAIIANVLPVSLFLSSRFSSVIPSLKTRLLLSFIYLALPNSWEVHANLTNVQTHFGLLAFMVIIAEPNDHLAWRIFDIGIVLLAGLGGPHAIMLTPIAARWWWSHRGKWPLIILITTCCCALIQATSILLTAQQTRSLEPLGATPGLFIRILSGQIFLAALIGQKGYLHIFSPSGWYTAFASVIAVMGLLAVAKAFFKAPEELRLFIIFAAMMFGAALISPNISAPVPRWETSTWPGVNGRYWFIPMIAFVTVLLWMTGESCSRILRVFASMALLVMVLGIILDWRHPPFIDFQFREHARQFETAPKGAEVIIPINPPGWSMRLIKDGLGVDH
jgi:hypothetical protein